MAITDRWKNHDHTGVDQTFHFDADDEQVIIQNTMKSPAAHFAACADLRHEADIGNKGYSPSRDMRRVASVPDWLYLKCKNEGIDLFDNADWPKVASMLDDPEYAWIRTAPGKVSSRPARNYYSTRGW